MLIPALCAAVLGLAASIGLVGAVRQWARRRLVLDHPNDRSLHVHPTPRGGGIGIVVPVSLAMVYAGVVAPETRSPALWIVCGGLLNAAVGLIDDLRGLAALTRLTAHVIAAMFVVAGVGAVSALSWSGVFHVELGLAAVPFTIVLVVGLTNGYNFMDGVDGIAGGQAVVAGVGWFAAGYLTQDLFLAIVGGGMAGASLGFLLFNWAPASIFMGDVCSAFLGFVFAALSVYAAVHSAALAMAGILFVWPFVFDSAFTILRRVRRRENLLAAHRSHLYQRLVLTGMSHRTAAVLYAGLAGVGVAVGLCVACGNRAGSIFGAIAIVGLATGVWALVIRRERAV